MQQWDTATQVTTTSLNSQGSAMREQAEYSQSLEARLNRLSNAGTSLAQSMGEALISDSVVVFTESVANLANNLEGVVEKVGLLPPIFALAGAAIGRFNTKINSLTQAMIFGTSEMTRKQLAIAGLSRGATRGTVAVKGMTTALRGLASATVVGAVFAGVGFAIEKTIGWIGNYIKSQEEMRKEQEQTNQSIARHGDTIDELSERYAELSNIERNNKQEQEYVDIQNELAELLPSLKMGEDEYGNAILDNSEYLKDYIELYREILELEREANAEEARSKYDRASRQLETLNKEREDLAAEKDALDRLIKQAEDEGNEVVLPGYRESRSRVFDDIEQNLDDIGEKRQDVIGYLEDILTYETELSNVDREWLASLLYDLGNVDQLDEYATSVEHIRDIMGESFSFKGIDLSDLEALTDIANDINDGGDSWNSYRQALLNVGVEANQVNQILGELRNTEQDVADAHRDGGYAADANIPIYDELGNIINFSTEMFDENSDALDNNTESLWENASASEMLFGVTDDMIKKQEQAINVIQTLSQMENLNQQQKEMLEGATRYLEGAYPHLTGKIYDNIDAIVDEINMMTDLNNASGTNADVMMTNQDSITRSTIDASNQRIRALQEEARFLQQLFEQYRQESQITSGWGESLYTEDMRRTQERLWQIETELSEAYSTRRNAVYDSGVPRSNNQSSSSSSSGSGSSAGASSGSQKSPEEIAWENAQKALQEYINTLTDYDHKIQREQLLREQMTEGSAEYNRSVDKEISLLKNKQRETSKYITAMQRVINQDRISADRKRELTEEIQKQQNEYLKLDNQIYDHIQTQRERLANDSISLLQDTIRKRIKLLEGERDREIALLQERADAYTKYIDDKIQAMNREESEDDFLRQQQELTDEQIELRRQINILDLNDSQEATARKRELEQELAKSIENLEKLRRDRTSELRRQNLEDEKTRIQEELEAEKSAIEEKYDEQVYYLEQQLENEKYFAELREEVMAGNMANIQNIINGYIDDFSKYNENAIKEMGASWQELINLMNRASNLNKDIKNSTNSVVKSSSNSSSSSKSSSGSGSSSNSRSNSTGSSKGKITTGSRAKVTNNNAKAYMDSYGKQVRDWNEQARAAGVKYNDPLHVVNRRGNFAALSRTNSVNGAIAWVNEKDLVQLRSGGFTGNNEGVAMLHEKEIVLNKHDTNNLLDMVKVARDTQKAFDTKGIHSNQTSNTDKSLHLNINYYGDGTRQDANNFGTYIKDYMKKIGH